MTEGKDENQPTDSYDYKRLHSYPLIRVRRNYFIIMFCNFDTVPADHLKINNKKDNTRT